MDQQAETQYARAVTRWYAALPDPAIVNYSPETLNQYIADVRTRLGVDSEDNPVVQEADALLGMLMAFLTPES